MEIFIAMKEKIKLLPRAMILYLVFIVLMIIVISLKSNYYIDEIYSYGLSNYTGDGINITFGGFCFLGLYGSAIGGTV